jgi:hypothetical protein
MAAPAVPEKRIAVDSITLRRMEGVGAAIGEPIVVKSFEGADEALRGWADTAPDDGGHDKVEFTVRYADGTEYSGRYDLKSRDTEVADLAGHMRRHLEYMAGLRKPASMTEDEYRFTLSRYHTAEQSRAEGFLTGYELPEQREVAPAVERPVGRVSGAWQVVTGDTFNARTALKAIGGGQFRRDLGAWVFPGEKKAALEELLTRSRGLEVREQVELPAARVLVIRGQTYDMREALKGAGAQFDGFQKVWKAPLAARATVEAIAGVEVGEIDGEMPRRGGRWAGQGGGGGSRRGGSTSLARGPLGTRLVAAAAAQATTSSPEVTAPGGEAFTTEAPRDAAQAIGGVRTTASKAGGWLVVQYDEAFGETPARELSPGRVQAKGAEILAELGRATRPLKLVDHDGEVLGESPAWRLRDVGAVGSVPTRRGWVGRYAAPDGQSYYTRQAYGSSEEAITALADLKKRFEEKLPRPFGRVTSGESYRFAQSIVTVKVDEGRGEASAAQAEVRRVLNDGTVVEVTPVNAKADGASILRVLSDQVVSVDQVVDGRAAQEVTAAPATPSEGATSGSEEGDTPSAARAMAKGDETTIAYGDYKPKAITAARLRRMATRGKAPGWLVGTYNSRSFYSNAHFMLEGPAPTKQVGGELAPAALRKTLEQGERLRQAGRLRPIDQLAVEVLEPPEASRVWFGNVDKAGRVTVLDVEYHDLVMSRFPEGVFRSVGADEPVYVLDRPAKDASIVGVVMPMRMERSAVPESVAAALDTAWLRLGIPGAAPYGTLAAEGTKTASGGQEEGAQLEPDVAIDAGVLAEGGERRANDSRGTRGNGLNAEPGRIEIAFAERPAMEVRARLKAAGFRWEARSSCWSAAWTSERQGVVLGLPDLPGMRSGGLRIESAGPAGAPGIAVGEQAATVLDEVPSAGRPTPLEALRDRFMELKASSHVVRTERLTTAAAGDGARAAELEQRRRDLLGELLQVGHQIAKLEGRIRIPAETLPAAAAALDEKTLALAPAADDEPRSPYRRRFEARFLGHQVRVTAQERGEGSARERHWVVSIDAEIRDTKPSFAEAENAGRELVRGLVRRERMTAAAVGADRTVSSEELTEGVPFPTSREGGRRPLSREIRASAVKILGERRRWLVGEAADGRVFYSNGSFLLFGTPPVDAGGPAEHVGAAAASIAFGKVAADLVPVKPVMVSQAGGEEHVWLGDGSAVIGRELDFVLSQVPGARLEHGGAAESPLVVKDAEGNVAGLLMPATGVERPPAVVERLGKGPESAVQRPVQVRTTREGSVYEGERADQLIAGAAAEQRSRLQTIRELEAALADVKGGSPKEGRLRAALAKEREVYEAAYGEAADAVGEEAAAAMRREVEGDSPARPGEGAFPVAKPDEATPSAETSAPPERTAVDWTPGTRVRTSDGREGVIVQVVEVDGRRRALVLFPPSGESAGYEQFHGLERLALSDSRAVVREGDGSPGGPAPVASAIVKPPLEGHDRLEGMRRLIDLAAARLEGEGIADNRVLTELANEAFGGTRAEGRYTPKEAYDAVEAAVNRWVLANGARLAMLEPPAALAELRALLMKLPRQTDRTIEQEELQQFSTPPTLAYVAAKALGVRPGELVLEPSAGVGGLAVFVRAWGARVVVNEVAERRRVLLQELGFERVTADDAEMLHDVLDASIRPTAILMNPPFSATGGRVRGHRTIFGARHVEQALSRLEPGGRLVGIVGQGMAFGSQGASGPRQATGAAFKEWWEKVMARYTVRLNLRIPGDEYGKYGTTFANQLIVIDKVGATPGRDQAARLASVRWGAVGSLEEALDAVREVATNRPAERPVGAESADAGRGAVERGPREAVAGLGDPGGAAAERSPDAGPRGRRAGVDPGAATADPPEGKTAALSGGEPRPGPDGAREVGSVPGGGGDPADVPGRLEETAAGVSAETGVVRREDEEGGTYVRYAPTRLKTDGLKCHPADIVEAASMAAVDPPAITYRSALPQAILTDGRVSDIQYESILYAGQRHSQRLPGGERGGYFVGDGTGVGKGRIIAGILLDNWLQGRQRALWTSVSNDLIESAIRDLKDVAGEGRIPIVQINEYAPSDAIELPKGIIFTTYASLVAKSKLDRNRTRLEQVEQWLGQDCVIVLDEAHKAKNALAGERGEPTQTGQAILELQKHLRDARVVYSSATGATDVRHMAYMTRLGLWGPNTSFPGGFEEFLSEVESGGVGVMEMVARDLKALGIYNSRMLSFRGVEYSEVTHALSPEQRDMYDAACRGWQVALQNIDEALEITNAGRTARRNALTQFWADQQRFFRQVTTALKVPTVIRQAETALDDGKSVVIGLIGTGESRTALKVSRALAESGDLDDLDFTPREVLAEMVRRAFPTALWREVTSEDGSTIKQMVFDDDGKPVESRLAVEMRDRLLDELSALRLPDNPLDQLVNHFGIDRVAELTGRKKRLLRDGKTGRTEYVKRAPEGVAMKDVNVWEMEQFQSGKKRLAIISDAASTGISLHASNREQNKQQRVLITAELGWSADTQMQKFGRVHRSDQAVPPSYILVATDVGGERRFCSSIARRLASLGALTKGQRDAAGGGELAKYNFETVEGKAALNHLYGRLERGEVMNGLDDPIQVLRDLGLLRGRKEARVVDEDRMNVPRFLNRLLALDLDRQNRLFAAFEECLETTTANAKALGTFDEGVQDIRGIAVRLKGEPEVVHVDKATGAETQHYVLEVDRKAERVRWDVVATRMATREAQGFPAGFHKQARSGRVVYAERGAKRTEIATGSVIQMIATISPRRERDDVIPEAELQQKYEKLEASVAETMWREAEGKIPERETRHVHIIAGAILPLWQRLKSAETKQLQVVRATTESGQRVVGIAIPEAQVGRTLEALGVERSAKTPAEILRLVLDEGGIVNLVAGLQLRRTRVHGESRIEVSGADLHKYDEFRRTGLIEERIEWRNRFFVPTAEEEGTRILAALLERYPATADRESAREERAVRAAGTGLALER